MILKARNKWWRQLVKLTPNHINSVIESCLRYGNDEKYSEIDSDMLSQFELETLKEIADGYAVPAARALRDKIDTILGLYAAPLADIRGSEIKKLELLPDMIRAYVGPAARRWIYTEREDEMVLPYFVSSVKYTPNRREGNKQDGFITYPAYVTMYCSALRRGGGVSLTYIWYSEQVLGKTVVDLFNAHQIYLETPWAAKKYDAEIEQYQKVIAQLGAQYAAVGYGSFVSTQSYYSTSKLISMFREGYPTKVVIDDNEEDENDTKRSSSRGRSKDDSENNSFWKNYDLQRLGKAINSQFKETDDEDDTDEPTEEELKTVARVTPPIHPYVRAFDLDKHDYVIIHVNNLQDYRWDETLIDKLILPAATKDMIQILVSGTNDSKEDIIRGKMQGVIVIATGDPGTGKTLTAEVFSETIKRPLYVVQCAQLGTDASTIEQRLNSILRRAQRWQAILLIDEADVYIRARGDDIQQNAIVGVFLRVLEYYRGVLFMTSNRATIIDDAIMSRASSWIRYAMPDEDELRQLWKVLSTQYEIGLTEEDIDSLMIHLPKLSGRCVRNLCKLARHLSQARKEKVTEAMLRSVAQFQYLPHQTDEELRDAAK